MPTSNASVHPGARRRLAGIVLVAAALASACSSNGNGTTAGTPAILKIAAGDNIVDNVGAQVGPFVALVTDTGGTPVPNVTVHFASGSPQLTIAPTSGTTNTAGTTFTSGSLSYVAGAYTVTATAAGIATPIVFHVISSPAAPSRFAIGGGNNQTAAAGSALSDPLTVTVSDQYNNPIDGVTVAWAASRGVLASTSTRTGDNGVSGATQTTFTLPPGITGPSTITATATINTTVMILTFTATGT